MPPIGLQPNVNPLYAASYYPMQFPVRIVTPPQPVAVAVAVAMTTAPVSPEKGKPTPRATPPFDRRFLRKTEMCRGFLTRTCRRKPSSCCFAHGAEDLVVLTPEDRRKISSVPHAFKTTHCEAWLSTGACKYGIRCAFLHDTRFGDSPIHSTDGEFECFGCVASRETPLAKLVWTNACSAPWKHLGETPTRRRLTAFPKI